MTDETPQAVTAPETAPVTAAPATSGSDVPPDRLAINPRSPFFDEEKLRRGIGIRFKDVVRTNVEEYCISEGWVRVQAGKAMDRKGNPLTLKLNGTVEAWFEDLGEGAPVAKI
ncbi:DUF3297 family protein [Novosphingobium sp. AAP83]|uniref:DUF3297 family protein n=1 Tax=Novosphingobium sp. AAP83 TaxID=1523425 RepID=UPI0009EA4FEA|nr:DUF3297 family protein [Novosphingobium sp. AAP83]